MEAYAVPTWESGAAHKSQDTGIVRFMQTISLLYSCNGHVIMTEMLVIDRTKKRITLCNVCVTQ